MNKKHALVLAAGAVAIALMGAGCAPSSSTTTSQTAPARGAGRRGFGNASSTMRGNMPNIPAGDSMFFGTIQSVSGSNLVISGFNRGNATTTPMTTNVLLTASTTFGPSTTASNLTTGARVFGYGTKAADGTVSAAQIQVTPAMPEGGRYNGGMRGPNNTQQ